MKLILPTPQVLSLFGSGREEDKMVGYLSFLKVGPQLLKFVPGDKAKDLKNWLTIYGEGARSFPLPQRFAAAAVTLPGWLHAHLSSTSCCSLFSLLRCLKNWTPCNLRSSCDLTITSQQIPPVSVPGSRAGFVNPDLGPPRAECP